MDRDQMNFLFEFMHCLKGGTKEACVKVRNYLQYAAPIGGTIQTPPDTTCVRPDEFLEAVGVLLAAAFSQPDMVPKKWRCENDCANVTDFMCLGECNIDQSSTETCPYYITEDK